ncbi:hypothetical protein [Tahibacter amnicola]|uniref:Uncharacterized protein n=1 Tax=Tahibacter amnicola TaxID=2976241 RepID=A0ABY6BKD5_9GAMM|nr:hypothetical protein [Tahibacter amnicola]UXI70232.1 hypothetical protein N4264_11535 [Tahibacter amnicola]
MWSSACGSHNVSVARDLHRGTNRHTYSFCGPPATVDLAQIERRLRDLLSQSVLGDDFHLVRVP